MTMDIKVSDGNSRKKDLKKLESLCRFTKEGQWFTIHEIYDKPKEIEDKRKGRICEKKRNPKYNILTDKERNNEFDGYYVYAHIIDNKYMYIGKGCKSRAMNSMYERFEKEDYDKVEIKILARFENEIDALTYEKEMIDYYKSLGQCKYNDEIYHIGNMYNKEIKLQKEYDKLVNERELLVQKLNMIDLQIEDLKNKLT